MGESYNVFIYTEAELKKVKKTRQIKDVEFEAIYFLEHVFDSYCFPVDPVDNPVQFFSKYELWQIMPKRH